MELETQGSVEPLSETRGKLSRRDVGRLVGISGLYLFLASCGLKLGKDSYPQLPEDKDERSTDQMYLEIAQIESEVEQHFAHTPENYLRGSYVFGTLSRLCSSTLAVYAMGEVTDDQRRGNPNLKVEFHDLVLPKGDHDEKLSAIILAQLLKIVKITPNALALLKPIEITLQEQIGDNVIGFAHPDVDISATCSLIRSKVTFQQRNLNLGYRGFQLFAHELCHIKQGLHIQDRCFPNLPDKSVLDLYGMKRLMKYSYYFAKLTKQTQDLYLRYANTDLGMPDHTMELGWWAYGPGVGKEIITDFIAFLDRYPDDPRFGYSVYGNDIRMQDWNSVKQYFIDIENSVNPKPELPNDLYLITISRFILRHKEFFMTNFPAMHDKVINALINHSAHVHQHPFDIEISREELFKLSKESVDPAISEYYLSIMRLQEAWLNLYGYRVEDLISMIDNFPAEVIKAYKESSNLGERIAEAVESNLSGDSYYAEIPNSLAEFISLDGLKLFGRGAASYPVLQQRDGTWFLKDKLDDGSYVVHHLNSIDIIDPVSLESSNQPELVILSPDSPNVYLILPDKFKRAVSRIIGPFDRNKLGDITNINNFKFFTLISDSGRGLIMAYKSGLMGMGLETKGLALATPIDSVENYYFSQMDEDTYYLEVGGLGFTLSKKSLDEVGVLDALLSRNIAILTIAPEKTNGKAQIKNGCANVKLKLTMADGVTFLIPMDEYFF